MKKIYCIEEWIKENDGTPCNWTNIDDASFWSTLECPWKLNASPIVQEYDDEEEFKTDLLNLMNNNCVIGRVFIREVSDDYSTKVKEFA